MVSTVLNVIVLWATTTSYVPAPSMNVTVIPVYMGDVKMESIGRSYHIHCTIPGGRVCGLL